MRAPLSALLGVVLLFVFLAPCGARNYHVNAGHPAASDSNPGTPDQPLSTLQRGAELAQPGDTVFISGVYHESLVTERDGMQQQPIVFAAAPGASAVMDGGDGSAGDNGVVCTHSWLHFEGLEIRNWAGNGMWFEGGAGILIRDCEVHEVTYGIGMTDGCHDFTLERVVMHHFDLYGFDASSGSGDCYNGIFIDCVSHTGRDPEQNVDGFALGHGTQHGFTFIRCVTHGVYDGFDISARNSTLTACAAYNCTNGGYKLWQDAILLVNCLAWNNESSNVELDWDGDPGTVTLWNCTFHDAGTFNVWVENSADTLLMLNCILSGGDLNGLAFEQRDAGSYSGNFNLFQNDIDARMINVGYEDQYAAGDLDAWRAATGQDTQSLAISDLNGVYVDADAYDLHLAAGSPARDAGANSWIREDYDGNPRPVGPTTDIGAFEYQSGTDAKSPPLSPALRLEAWPNPSRAAIAFHVRGTTDAPAELAVYDLLGRRLWHRILRRSASGVVLMWDGNDEQGIRACGTAFAILRSTAGNRILRILIE